MANNNYQNVRIGWQPEGQPGPKFDQDTVFVRANIIDDDYNRQRDIRYATNNLATVRKRTTYHRMWQIFWEFYGPNSLDQARKLKSGLMDGTFQVAANFALMTDVADPTRAPELFEGRWWERSDLTAIFNELVTEDSLLPTIDSAQIIVETEKGIVGNFNMVRGNPTFTKLGNDNFNRSDRDLNFDFQWAAPIGTSANNYLRIISNSVGIPTDPIRAGGIMMWTPASIFATQNQYAQARFTRITSGYQQLVLKGTGNVNFFNGYLAGTDVGRSADQIPNYVIAKVSNGIYTLLLSSDQQLAQAGDVVKFELVNGTLRLTVNGNTVLVYGDTQPFNTGLTGIALDDPTGSDSGFLDDFETGIVTSD